MDCNFRLLILIVNLSKLNVMEKILEVTDKYLPFNKNPNPIPGFSNFSPPYMPTLSLSGFMIGLQCGCFQLL